MEPKNNTQSGLNKLGIRPALSFFTPAQRTLLANLCEMIIPTDVESPGANDTDVLWYIEKYVDSADPITQGLWLGGLEQVDLLAEGYFGYSFRDSDECSRATILSLMSRNEGAPENNIEQFFDL